MHVRDYSVTTASMVAELSAGTGAPLRTWACIGSPCVSVYVPAFPPALPIEMADATQWERFARLRARAEADAGALAEVRAVLAPVEAELWDEADVLAAKGDPAAFHEFASSAWRPVDVALGRLGA
jgi:hypothetical protein